MHKDEVNKLDQSVKDCLRCEHTAKYIAIELEAMIEFCHSSKLPLRRPPRQLLSITITLKRQDFTMTKRIISLIRQRRFMAAVLVITMFAVAPLLTYHQDVSIPWTEYVVGLQNRYQKESRKGTYKRIISVR